MHGVFWVLHILALLFGVVWLVITVPAHLIGWAIKSSGERSAQELAKQTANSERQLRIAQIGAEAEEQEHQVKLRQEREDESRLQERRIYFVLGLAVVLGVLWLMS